MSKELTAQEANRILAEFMGTLELRDATYCWAKHPETKTVHYPRYSQSLDALVPVWENLNASKVEFHPCTMTYTVYIGMGDDRLEFHQQGCDTLQSAAAIATAKAVLALKERKC